MTGDSSTNVSGIQLVENTLSEIRHARKTLNDDLGSHLPKVISETHRKVDAALNRISQDKDAMAIMATRGYNAETIKQAWSKGFGGELEKAMESVARNGRSSDQAQAYWEKVASSATQLPAGNAESQNVTRPLGRSR